MARVKSFPEPTCARRCRFQTPEVSMRKWRRPAAMAALLLAAYWFGARPPSVDLPILRAEPRLKQLPRRRSSPARTRLASSAPGTIAAAQEPEPEPDAVWLRVESSAGEPLQDVSV